jgi:hypothetical protein
MSDAIQTIDQEIERLESAVGSSTDTAKALGLSLGIRPGQAALVAPALAAMAQGQRQPLADLLDRNGKPKKQVIEFLMDLAERRAAREAQ